ncbi:DUF4300 family protein [Capnocytophaga sp. HP1101]
MKKLLLITLSLATIACQQKKTTTEKTSPQLTYSNLVDTATQNEVQKELVNAGISRANVNAFLESVNLFNQTVGSKVGLVPKGFVTIDSLLPKYDEVAIQTQWTKQYPLFQGYNCRITSFGLLRDLIAVQHPVLNEQNVNEVLFVDKDVLVQSPRRVFSPKQTRSFLAFFSAIPTQNTKDIKEHLATVQQAWEAQGVQFLYRDDFTKASMIAVLFHNYFSEQENYLFVGHVGVLVPTAEGKLLFIEKLAFQEPYQTIKFANRRELNDYLMNRYDVEWNQPTAIPFIMENDQLMEGYRPNPYKREQGL